jgi:hypothetical protein
LSSSCIDDKGNLIAFYLAFEKDWLAKLVSFPYIRLLCLVYIILEFVSRLRIAS